MYAKLETARNFFVKKKFARTGYAHIAFSVGSKEKVDALTAELKVDGYEVVSEMCIRDRYIPGAEVDDPVMQVEDNGYYLKLDENTTIFGHSTSNCDPDGVRFTKL